MNKAFETFWISINDPYTLGKSFLIALDSEPLKKPAQPKSYDIWYHLLLDIYDCVNLDDHKIIKAFFKELIKDLEMKPLTDILIVSVDNDEGHGTSALQMITTSSITYHADDKYYCAFIDVFSCKAYDPQIPIRLVKKYFNPKDGRIKFIYRAE